ncbi:MAG: hypothetical protein P1R58_00745 [bacterium]|nr:hypothetical protein [bacterium]
MNRKQQIQAISVRQVYGLILLLSLLYGSVWAGSGSVGIHGGIILPRDNYIRYADLAPKLSLHYAVNLNARSTLATRFDIGAAYFQSSSRTAPSGLSVYANYVREYGYSFHAGLQYHPTFLQLWKPRLRPSLIVQPGLYLMNTEIEYITSSQNQPPSLDHQFMGRVGLRLGIGLDLVGPHETGFTLGISWDQIPQFERLTDTDSEFRSDSRTARYWTITLGLLIPVYTGQDEQESP